MVVIIAYSDSEAHYELFNSALLAVFSCCHQDKEIVGLEPCCSVNADGISCYFLYKIAKI